MSAINRNIYGIDENNYVEMVNDIKNTSVGLKEKAVAELRKIYANSALVTAGNESRIKADSDIFDEVLNYKEK